MFKIKLPAIRTAATLLAAGAFALSLNVTAANAFGLRHCKLWGPQQTKVNPADKSAPTKAPAKTSAKVQAQR
jgi:hypothetical protein